MKTHVSVRELVRETNGTGKELDRRGTEGKNSRLNYPFGKGRNPTWKDLVPTEREASSTREYQFCVFKEKKYTPTI